MHNFSNLFWNENLNVSDNSSLHHQEFFTAHTIMVYVIQVCWQLASRRSLLASCQQTCMTYTITVCAVKNSWWWTEELSETCRFSFQNKFEKLMHLVVYYKKPLTYAQIFAAQSVRDVQQFFLYSWFRASWLWIHKIQQDATVCMHLFTASLLHMFRASIAPIIRSTKNCNRSLWYRS